MKTLLTVLTAGILLAACGADGPPTPPEERAPGVTISGDARIGVSGRL
jgi:predicted small lipoprotein YifL